MIEDDNHIEDDNITIMFCNDVDGEEKMHKLQDYMFVQIRNLGDICTILLSLYPFILLSFIPLSFYQPQLD